MTVMRAAIPYGAQGQNGPSRPLTHTGDATADFAAWLRDQGHTFSPLTVYDHIADLEMFVRWFQVSTDNSFTPSGITPADVDQYRLHLQAGRKLKPATVARRIEALRVFFDWAVEQRLVADSPVRVVPAGELPIAPTSIGEQTFGKLLAAANRHDGARTVAIFQLLRHTGIRISQLCGLRVSDLTLSDDHGQLTIGAGQGRRYRKVPLDADVRRALGDYLAVRPKVNDSHIFVGQRRTALTYSAVRRLILDVGRLAGFDQVTARAVRRTLGPGLSQADFDVVTIAD